MARNQARIEELSDSDPDEMDPNDFEPPKSNNSIIDPSQILTQSRAPQSGPRSPNADEIKEWQCLYPLYFDGARTRAQGRRVRKDMAVENPLAREICDAVFGLGLRLAFEPNKTHPKDWANPGRVKVLLKANGKPVSKTVKNSMCTAKLELKRRG